MSARVVTGAGTTSRLPYRRVTGLPVPATNRLEQYRVRAA
jgi:hypothetical protein